MSEPQGQNVKWRLTQQAFEKFLATLHADRGAAAERYEQIRAKLTRFFEWRACAFPDERADDTINRVIRIIDERGELSDPAAYCFGVAKLVLLEAVRQQTKEQAAFQELQRAAPPPVDDDEDGDHRLECLRACLKELPPEHQALIREYYGADAGRRIDGRKLQADRLGIGLNALRIRAHRVSDRLERCVNACLRRFHGSMK
jgi:DNA-directed RNA polymerase specialized sigma24 family protein